MGGWLFPQFIYREVNIATLDIGMLVYYHDNLHILWGKLEDGYNFEWTFFEIYKLHHAVVREMKNRGINHLAPINDLDKVHYFSDADLKKVLAYSVEKKMNGFPVSAHKKGKEVKIFSEQKKELTTMFPTLIEAIIKLSNSDFIIDGELISYEKEKALGRKYLMEYTEVIKPGVMPDDKNIKFHIWDIVYYNKSIDDLELRKRLEFLKKLKFNERIQEIERKTISNKEDLTKAIDWASSLENSEGTVVKDLNASYSSGEGKSWKIYRKLTPMVVSVLKRIPQKEKAYNYLVGAKADKKFLDSMYVQDERLVLGHTFNTEQVFEVGDNIRILIEDVKRHEKKGGVHYSIYKPRIDKKTDESLFTVDDLEAVVNSMLDKK